MSLEAPVAAQRFHQRRARAAGLAVRAVVGAHHGLDLRVPDEGAEGGQIALLHVLGRDDRVEAVAQGLGPAVRREVLGAGGGLERFALALQAAHEGAAEAGGQIGVLAVGLVAAAPAGIAENVDVRRPHRQPVVDIAVALRGEGVVFGPRLGRDRVRDPLEQRVVEHGGQADRLGKARRGPAAGQTVERLVPPVVCRDAEPFDGGRVKAELTCRFLGRHAADQLFRPFFCLLTRHSSA